MYLRDPNAPPPPRVTCPDCGLEYVDDSDWSGSAHGERHCREHLQKRLAEVIAERDITEADAGRRIERVAELERQLEAAHEGAKATILLLDETCGLLDEQRVKRDKAEQARMGLEKGQALLLRVNDELQRERDELASRGHFHGEPCYFCKKPINSFAANPGLWAVTLCHADEPGVVKPHHVDCVMTRLDEHKAWLAAAFEIACDSPELLVERVKRLVKERNEARQRAADEVELADCLRRERDKAVSALKAATAAIETLHGQLGVMDEHLARQMARAEEAEKKCAELLRGGRV